MITALPYILRPEKHWNSVHETNKKIRYTEYIEEINYVRAGGWGFLEVGGH